MMPKVHVVALGGSLLRPEEEEQRSMWLGRLRQLVVHLEGIGQKLGLVIGGGAPAREGIELARNCVSDSASLDQVGIAATRLNATILQQIMLSAGCKVNPEIPSTIQGAADSLQEYNIVVMGGTTPGHTTDAVAVALAREANAAHCIIATNVSHVYTADPRHNSDAQKIQDMTLQELAEITGVGKPLEPGASAVVDPVAVAWAIECNLTIVVLDGREISRLEEALEGLPFEGTLIRG